MSSCRFDDSGKLRTPSAVELLAADCENAILSYTTGTMEGGRHYYAYIAVKPSMYEEFYALTAQHQSIILGDYGTVIAAGFEKEAPPEVRREMRDMYGFDEHYVEKLQVEIQQQSKSFHDRREEKRLTEILTLLKAQDNGAAAN